MSMFGYGDSDLGFKRIEDAESKLVSIYKKEMAQYRTLTLIYLNRKEQSVFLSFCLK
jgi:hypothetical protein